MRTISKIKIYEFSITTALSVVVLLFFIVSCSKEKVDKIGAIKDRAAMPMVHATDITTLISDSGVTRYRITAPCWDDFDKSAQPYWEFKKGIHFEKFNTDMKVDANIHSLYARFNKNEQIWELRGKVKAINLEGELFETEQMFWNERQERIYSDSLIKITQATHIITGIGFESNQSMTKYLIKKPQGIFPITENNGAASPNSPAAIPVKK
ncbi:MAG: LPS export ABC transporter periplasmic protein LptC [Paludibacter sp.]